MALQSITGKRPEPVIAEKGDSSKKIRQGMPMGATVTLQGKDMFLFVDKMTQCVLPRISDWKGVHPRGGDNGSLTLELSAAAIGYFPDIEPHFDMFPRLFDTTVVFETTGSTDLEAQMLLSAFQIPIMQESDIEKEPEAAPEEDDKYAQIKLAKTRVERQALAAELARDAKKEK